MAARRGDGERLSSGREAGRGRFLIVVLLAQLVLATAFVVLVATDSLPIPGIDGGHVTGATETAPAARQPSP